MTDPVNGGLPEAAAIPVSGGIPPHERIARSIEADDDSDLSGFATYAPHPAEAASYAWQGDEHIDSADDEPPPAGAAPEGAAKRR